MNNYWWPAVVVSVCVRVEKCGGGCVVGPVGDADSSGEAPVAALDVEGRGGALDV